MAGSKWLKQVVNLVLGFYFYIEPLQDLQWDRRLPPPATGGRCNLRFVLGATTAIATVNNCYRGKTELYRFCVK